MTNILFCGKWPPIQGGVSRESYEFVVSALEHGHRVRVVTNADDVDATFRMRFAEGDLARVRLAAFGKSMKLRNTERVRYGSYIPWASPFLSSLLGSLLDEVSAEAPDVILGSYLEPYGIAAALAGQLTDTPVLIRHAGSDIGRLAKVPSLKMAYRRVLSGVRSILTVPSGGASAALDDLGVPEDRRYILRGDPFNFEGFSDAASLDIEGLLSVSKSNGESSSASEAALPASNRPFEPDGLVIGIYGKAGPSKGTVELAEGLGVLAQEGIPFTFLAMSTGWPSHLEMLQRVGKANDELARRTWFLPSVPTWRVPEFLARCDIVAFLENNFSIEFHGPRVPLEVIAARRVLMLSTDQHQRLSFNRALVDGKNVLLVDLAKRSSDITARLREVLVQREKFERLRGGAVTLPKLLGLSIESRAQKLKHPMLSAVEELIP